MLYRRHLNCCKHRREQRYHKRCACPIWFDARIKGRRVHKSMHLTDWDEAELAAQQWLENGAPASVIKPTKEGPITLEKAWEDFLAQARMRNLRPATIYKYDLLRRRMLVFAERRRLMLLNQFDVAMLEKFQGEWNEGALARSKKLERLKAFFRAAFTRRWIEQNPAQAMRGPKLRPRPTLPFTQGEMARILSALEHYPDKTGKIGRDNAIRLRAFVLTLRYTGMRVGDVTALSVDRVAGNKIFLYTQKTGIPVSCILPPFVAEALKSMPRLSETYYFWTGNSTLHTAIGTWQRSLKNLFKLAEVPRGYAHRFRDTFSISLLLAGVPMEEVSILLGHTNVKITQAHYSPWVRDRQQQLEADLERAWSRDPLVQAMLVHQSTAVRDTRPN